MLPLILIPSDISMLFLVGKVIYPKTNIIHLGPIAEQLIRQSQLF